jgi:hypothetical protein
LSAVHTPQQRTRSTSSSPLAKKLDTKKRHRSRFVAALRRTSQPNYTKPSLGHARKKIIGKRMGAARRVVEPAMRVPVRAASAHVARRGVRARHGGQAGTVTARGLRHSPEAERTNIFFPKNLFKNFCEQFLRKTEARLSNSVLVSSRPLARTVRYAQHVQQRAGRETPVVERLAGVPRRHGIRIKT